MKIKRIFLFGLIFVFFIIVGYFAYRFATGRSLREPFIRIGNIAGSLFGHTEVIGYNKGEYKNVIFVHHSVGHNLISEGNLREQFQQLGYSFWDQDYIAEGLTKPDGKPSGYSYDIPGDNTDTDGLTAIFQQPVLGLPVNAFSAFLQHEVIIFKSCYPNSQINDDNDLEVRKQDYLIIRKQIDQHPDHIFFLLTSPPLNPAETDPAAAARARILAKWLISPDFSTGHPNLFVFDLYDLLAEGNQAATDANMLKLEYRNGSDSHPNEVANLQIAPLLANFVNLNIEQYRKEAAIKK